MLVLGDIVKLSARRYPDKTALIMDEVRVNFMELNHWVNQIAHGLLENGVKPGDRIGIWSRNCLEYIPIMFAIWKCGGIIVPINFRYKVDEVAFTLSNSEPKVLFYDDEFSSLLTEVRKSYEVPLISFVIRPNGLDKSLKDLGEKQSLEEPDLEVDPWSAAMIMYTSGTTGFPKGAVFNHQRELLDNTSLGLEGDLTHNDVMLVVMPMFHNSGISGCILPGLLFGCTCVLTTGSFEPELILSAIERWGVSIINMVPTMLSKLVNDPCISKYRCPTLKKIWYGSSAISDAILQASLRTFNSDFYQFFGQAESGMLLVLKPEDHAERSQFTGREIMRADVRVVDEEGLDIAPGGVGEIISRHRPLGMDQYWGNKELTAGTIVDGWIHTGDLARVEGGGYYTVVDRSKDMIVSGAEKIYSKEIENVLGDHSAVAEAAVFAIPDDLWGEAVCAAVVLRDGCAASEQDIIDFCASRLSSYKKPKKVEFRQELPKNSAGKVTKNPLKEPYWAGRAKRV